MGILSKILSAPRENLEFDEREHPDIVQPEWSAFATEVDPDAKNPIVVYQALAPWHMFIDLSECDQNQHFEFVVELGIQYHTADVRTWIVDQRLRVRRELPTNLTRDMVLVVNEQPASILPFVIVEPTDGPWLARLTAVQTNGIKKRLRYLVE